MVIALAGCGEPTSSERLDGYVAELQRTLAEAAVAPARAPFELPVYPDRRSVQLPLADLMISVFDFFDISRHCGLGTLVAERNSSLGLVMPYSQRFVYEQALLAGLRDCRDRLSSLATGSARAEALRADLERTVARKAQELPRVFWNATFGSEEFEALFSLSGGGALGGEELAQSGQATLEALDFLRALYLDRDHRDRLVDSSGFEAHLNNIRRESYGGRMLKTLRDLEHAVASAAELLEVGLDPKRRCERQAALTKLYQARVAGWLTDHAAAVERHGGAFLRSVTELADLPREPGAERPLGEGSQVFLAYRRRFLDASGADALWPLFQESLRRHRRQWERVLAPC